MPTLVVRPFSLNHDFRSILWGGTLRYNLLRAFCAGIVGAALMFFFPQRPEDRSLALATPLLWPLMYLVIFLPLGLVALVFARFLPFVGLFSQLLGLIAVTIGDPLIVILHAIRPSLVPIHEPPFFFPRLIVFLLKPGRATEIVIAA